MRLFKARGVLVRTDANDQLVSSSDAADHVAISVEAGSTEHAVLADATPTRKRLADADYEIAIELRGSFLLGAALADDGSPSHLLILSRPDAPARPPNAS